MSYPTYEEWMAPPDRSKSTAHQHLIYKLAREASPPWDSNLAAMIAEGCSDATVNARVTMKRVSEIRSLCGARALPDSTAADFVLLGYSPNATFNAILAAGKNQSGLALQMWAQRRYPVKQKRMH